MYKIIDTLNLEEDKILTEKEIRDIYKNNVKEVFWNWQGCGDNKILNDLLEELANVYTCNMEIVINNLKEDLGYKVEEIKEA